MPQWISQSALTTPLPLGNTKESTGKSVDVNAKWKSYQNYSLEMKVSSEVGKREHRIKLGTCEHITFSTTTLIASLAWVVSNMSFREGFYPLFHFLFGEFIRTIAYLLHSLTPARSFWTWSMTSHARGATIVHPSLLGSIDDGMLTWASNYIKLFD